MDMVLCTMVEVDMLLLGVDRKQCVIKVGRGE